MCSPNKILSVVIVTYNSERDIFDCINSILRVNTIGEALEIIVVDNNSAHFADTSERLKELFPSIVIIPNTHNGGYGQGNNIGIKAAKAPVVAIVNPDVRWTMPLIEEVLPMFDNPKTAIVGCRQMEDEHHAASAIHYAQHTTGFEKSIGEMLVNRLGIYCPKRMYLSGAFFFVRKQVMDEIGGYDENIFLYAEENDIRYRILALDKGYRICYRHDLRYMHPCHHRPLSTATESARIKADIYVLGKQGIPADRYYHTERAKCKWNIFLHLLKGNTKGIERQKQLLKLYES